MNVEATPQERHVCAMTIAGSDSGAGAGIQADLKTFAAHGIFGLSALTLVTVQNTQTVQGVHLVPADLVKAQVDALFNDFRIGAIKTGALGSCETIHTVARRLQIAPQIPLVVDPVMITKHGHALLDIEAISMLKQELLPLAAVVTPNLSEASVLSNTGRIETKRDMLQAAEAIAKYGCPAVVVKGGHMSGQPADLLWERGDIHWVEGERIDTPHTHGTGCTYSSAITANLVRGYRLVEAVTAAKQYITGALIHAQRYGKGINPVNHFWRTQPNFGAGVD